MTKDKTKAEICLDMIFQYILDTKASIHDHPSVLFRTWFKREMERIKHNIRQGAHKEYRRKNGLDLIIKTLKTSS